MECGGFLPDMEKCALSDCVGPGQTGRENLGAEVPVAVYRMLEYSLREELTERLGGEEQIAVFRSAGYRAGTYFAENCLDLTAEFPAFIAQVQRRLEELKIGLLRVEETEEDTGKMVLTISEDVDCSGLPVLGKTVCSYDEGFLAGLLTAYTRRPYSAVEVNCWAAGDRVCRFQAEVQNHGG